MIRKGFFAKIILLGIFLMAVAVLIAAGTAGGSDGGRGGQAETVFNQFVVSGGPIVWFVLLPMSVVMVSLSVQYCLAIRRKKLVPAGLGRDIATAVKHFGTGRLAMRLAGKNDLVSVAVVRAAAADPRGGQTKTLLAEALGEQALRLLRKIEWAGIIGNVAPMVGLFGTVLGMIKMFNSIVSAGGQPQPAQLAEGISVALVTTLWGLAIAIPALIIHGVFRNRIETLVSEAAQEAEQVLHEINADFYRRQRDKQVIGQQKLESRAQRIVQTSTRYPKEQNKDKSRQPRIIATK